MSPRGPVVSHHGDRPRDPGVLGQCCLDFTELDAQAAQLHLEIGAAQVFQFTGVAPSAPHRRCGTVRGPAPRTGRATNRSAVSPDVPDSRARAGRPPDTAPRRRRAEPDAAGNPARMLACSIPVCPSAWAPLSASVTRCAVECTVHSVGPYRLCSCTSRCDSPHRGHHLGAECLTAHQERPHANPVTPRVSRPQKPPASTGRTR